MYEICPDIIKYPVIRDNWANIPEAVRATLVLQATRSAEGTARAQDQGAARTQNQGAARAQNQGAHSEDMDMGGGGWPGHGPSGQTNTPRAAPGNLRRHSTPPDNPRHVRRARQGQAAQGPPVIDPQLLPPHEGGTGLGLSAAGGPVYLQPYNNGLEGIMAHMAESMAHLAGAVTQSNARLATLESQILGGMPGALVQESGPVAVRTSYTTRGSHNSIYAARGRRTGGRGGRRGTALADADLSIATKDLKDLSKTQKAARAAILKAGAQTLRILTGISKDDPWPEYIEGAPRTNATTGEPYFDVHFAARDGVTNAVNVKLLQQVARDVVEDIEAAGADMHLWLEASDVPFSEALVYALVKESWSNFKRKYAAARDNEKKMKMKANECSSRWQLRRKQKYRIVADGADDYAEVHGADPTPLLDISQMSDEASGPDPDSGETQRDWLARMAGHLGMSNLEPELLNSLQVFEVIRPNWRSDQYNDVLKWLRERHASKLTSKQMQSQKYRVRTSGRSTDIPAAIAPYNFGINQSWFDAHKDTDAYCALLADWGNYPGPPGFEALASVEDSVEQLEGNNQGTAARGEEDESSDDEA